MEEPAAPTTPSGDEPAAAPSAQSPADGSGGEARPRDRLGSGLPIRLIAAAALTLVAAVVAGVFLVVKPIAAREQSAAAPAEQKVVHAKAHNPLAPGAPAAAELPRRRTQVLVLNGSGADGAAGDAAERLRGRSYAVVGAQNASFLGFRRTIVLYRPGFRGEAERLARDVGVARRRVAPVDGMKRSELRGAQVVLILGG